MEWNMSKAKDHVNVCSDILTFPLGTANSNVQDKESETYRLLQYYISQLI